jgi:hypothetical protein
MVKYIFLLSGVISGTVAAISGLESKKCFSKFYKLATEEGDGTFTGFLLGKQDEE